MSWPDIEAGDRVIVNVFHCGTCGVSHYEGEVESLAGEMLTLRWRGTLLEFDLFDGIVISPVRR